MSRTPDAIILCGGAGVRLQSVANGAPKAMVTIADRPFLELLLRQLRRHNFHRVILAVGYRKEAIRSHFGERAFGMHLKYSAESMPLGTGGALRKAAGEVTSDATLVMNGDSYTDADLNRFTIDYRDAKADAEIVVVSLDGRGDCGSVMVDRHGRVTWFREKQSMEGAKYTNAGIYMVSRLLLNDIPSRQQISLETELLPRWLDEGRNIRAFICGAQCVDVGTPGRYRTAQHVLANVENIDPRSRARVDPRSVSVGERQQPRLKPL